MRRKTSTLSNAPRLPGPAAGGAGAGVRERERDADSPGDRTRCTVVRIPIVFRLFAVLLVVASCAGARNVEMTGTFRFDEIDYAPQPGGTVGESLPGLAQVVFVRPTDDMPRTAVLVYDDERLAAILAARTWAVHIARPGERVFMAASVGREPEFLEATLEAGRTYYVLLEVLFDDLGVRMGLTPVRPGTPEMNRMAEWLGSSQRVEVNPLGQKWDAENREAVILDLRKQRLPAWKARQRRVPPLAAVDGVE